MPQIFNIGILRAESSIDINRLFRTAGGKEFSALEGIGGAPRFIQFFGPRGDGIDRRGVLADLILPSHTESLLLEKTPIDFSKIESALKTKLSQFDSSALREKSAFRVTNSKEWFALIESITKLRESGSKTDNDIVLRKFVQFENSQFIQDEVASIAANSVEMSAKQNRKE
jgi:hypothetical protein